MTTTGASIEWIYNAYHKLPALTPPQDQKKPSGSVLERRPDKRDAKTGLVIKAGRPAPTLSNAVRILTEDSRWSGRIKYNEFSNAVEIDGIDRG